MQDENVDPATGAAIVLRARPYPAGKTPQTIIQHFAFVFDSMQADSTDNAAMAASLRAMREIGRDTAVRMTRYHLDKQITLADLVKASGNATYHRLYFEQLYPERFYDDNVTADGLRGTFTAQWTRGIPRRIRKIDKLLKGVMTDDPDALRRTREVLTEQRRQMEQVALRRTSQTLRTFR